MAAGVSHCTSPLSNLAGAHRACLLHAVDHEGLYAASSSQYSHVLPVYCLDPLELHPHPLGTQPGLEVPHLGPHRLRWVLACCTPAPHSLGHHSFMTAVAGGSAARLNPTRCTASSCGWLHQVHASDHAAPTCDVQHDAVLFRQVIQRAADYGMHMPLPAGSYAKPWRTSISTCSSSMAPGWPACGGRLHSSCLHW